METNAELFAVLKRAEIEPTLDRLATKAPGYSEQTHREFIAVYNHPSFWPDFEANYAANLLGEECHR